MGAKNNELSKSSICEFLAVCNFFEVIMPSVPQLCEKMRQNYCYGGCGKCARHAYSKLYGSQDIPDDLFPNAFLG
ncbi:MAG: hypothetical protein OEY01_09920 [Desulfobulbaceae bacterium]|nr:hypothetical protein [Desulfobulbaceae bacterium]HIJ79289.1 hypothetical protein [Deltaproteobacteria bacterium]